MNLRCLSAFYLAAAAFVPSAVGICVDDPVDWVADHVYDCAYMEDQPGNCDVIGEGTDGKTASEACCVCGGGDEKLCDNEPEWFFLNNNGVEKDCDWFADDADVRCEKHGEKEGEFDMTANDACCACGGGYEPRTCSDEEDWFFVNNNGAEKDCDWFAKDPDVYCQKHGHKEGEFDLTANQACCACGGGDIPRQCTDEDDWFVSHNGKDHTCDWFAKDPDTRCEKHGNRVGEDNMTADEACCACGGGSDAPKLCESEPDWFVENNGKTYTCEWFGKKDGRCEKHGNRRGEDSLTAEQACCECGGGSTIG